VKIKLTKTIFLYIGFSLLILSFFFCTARVTANSENDLQKKPLLDKLIILSTIGNIPDEASKIVKFQSKVDLFAVVKDREKNYYLGDDDSLPDKIKIDNKIYSIEDGTLKRWNKETWGSLNIEWYRIMPKMQPSYPRSEYEWYANVFTEGPDEGKFAGYAVIEYIQTLLDENGWTVRLKKEAGTARFRAELNYNGKLLSSPGQLDPLHPNYIVAEDYYKGIKPSVYCISRTSNNENKLIRYIEALRGVPWLWGADYKRGEDPKEHQSELPNAIGIECADLIISALRAMGNKNLQYIKANQFAEGKYTVPLDERTFRFVINDIFRSWIPRGIAYKDSFYVCGRGKIQIFDRSFRLKRVIEKPLSDYLDIAISSQDDHIYLINDSQDREIEILDQEGNLKSHFRPKIECTSKIGDQFYTREKEIRATGVAIDEKKNIYLLASDSLYVFGEQGNLKKEIKLESLYHPFVPTGPIALDNDRIYIPVYEKQILIYDLKGKIIDKRTLNSTPLAMDIKYERYYLLLMAPLRIEVRNLAGTFLTDSYERLIDEEGEDVIIPIGTQEIDLQVGDLIMSREEEEENYSHTLVLYEDSNKNGILDFSDKLIFAGHEGVMIKTVKEKLGVRNFTLRRLDESIVKESM